MKTRRLSVCRTLVLSMLAVLFVFPAFAHAAPASKEATVVVTVKNEAGAVLKGARVFLELKDANGNWNQYDWNFSDESGVTTFTPVSFEGTTTARVYSRDETGTYTLTYSPNFTLVTADSTVKLTLVMKRDTFGPNVWIDDYTNDENWSMTDLDLTIGANDYRRNEVDNQNDGDHGSGVAMLYYSINNGAFVAVANPYLDAKSMDQNLFFTLNGVNLLSVYAVDRNGNTSKVKSDLIYIDKTAPEVGYSRGGVVTFTAADSLSGVGGTFYRPAGATDYVAASAVAAPASGSILISYFAADKAGNSSVARNLTIWAPAKLSKPAPSTFSTSSTKTFYVKGSVSARPFKSGKVYVYKYSKGAYRYVSKKSFKTTSTGSYKLAFKLKAGKYTFQTQYGANTATVSDPPVKSARSGAVTVR